jgi:hypothetical protein
MGWGILSSLIATIASFIGNYFFNKYVAKLDHVERVKSLVMDEEPAVMAIATLI